MFSGHRLAVALGVVDGSALKADDEASRKQLIRAGEAMVDAGLAIVLNRPGTKIPLCTLTTVERRRADQEVRDTAAAGGDVNSHLRMHRCGLGHAITDRKTATRVLTRMARRGVFNLGVEPRASRVCIVDLDTAAQSAEFALRCGHDRPTLTVRSPGQRDARTGNWVHKDGGHIWFEVPEGLELPKAEGIYTDAAGWTAVWGEHQVLVPPSVRPEGAYVLVGSTHPMPAWLRDVIVSQTAAKLARRTEARRRRAANGPSAIDDWSTGTSWATILTADGWTETGLADNCGCPIYTAPGDHGSPKSATAHEPGCAIYTCERGHGPLHVWTDYPSEAIAAAIAEYGTRTLTKIQVWVHTEGGGHMGRALSELGIEHAAGPTVIRGPLGTWVKDPFPPGEPGFSPPGNSDNHSRTGATDSDDSGPDLGEDDTDDDSDDDEDASSVFTAEMLRERKVRQEVDALLIKRDAAGRVAALDAPPLQVFGAMTGKNQPRPRGAM